MSIQLTTDGKAKLTAVINKVFAVTAAGKDIKHILDRHVMGGSDPANPREGGEIGAFRDVYPPLQTGPDIAIVNDLVGKLYDIYSDIANFVNTSGFPTEGVLTPGVDGDLDKLVSDLKGSLDNGKTGAENPNKGYQINLMERGLFQSLSRDALVASIIRGYRIFALATNLDLTNNVGGGDYSYIFGKKKELLDSPFPEFDPSEYSEKNRSSAAQKHREKYLSHPDDSALPFNELGAHTLAIFFRKGSPFANYIRSRQGLDAEHINKTYPEHKYPFEELKEGKKGFTGGGGGMDSRHEMAMPAIDYVFIFLKRFVRTCLCNQVDSISLRSLFGQADSVISSGDERDKITVAPGDEHLDYLNGNPDGNQHEELLDQELGQERDPDILPRNVASEFGGEDRHLMTMLCNGALLKLCADVEHYADKFDFHVLNTERGSGKIEVNNIYDTYIKDMFKAGNHSEEGIKLIYHFYNNIGKDNIGLTLERLKTLKSQLPKSPAQVVLNKSNTADLMSRIDRNSMNSEAVTVACDVAAEVFHDTVGIKNFRDGSSAELVKPISNLLSPTVCEMPNTLLNEMKKLWGVSKEAPTPAPSLEEARKLVNVRSTKLTPEAAVSQYFDQIKQVFDNIDPNLGYSKSDHPKSNDYVFLYPTEENREKAKYDLFADRESYISAYHSMLEDLMNSRLRLTNCSDLIEFENILISIFKKHFTGDFWKLKAGTSTIAALVVPTIRRQGGGVMEVKDLLDRKLANNISNQLIKAVLEASYSSDESKPVYVASILSDEQKSVNTAYAVIAMLHCRIEFLVAIKHFSDEILKIFEAYRPTIEPVLPKYKQLLSDYENFEHNQRLRHLIDILIKNIVFRITNPGQENLEEHPEKEDAEFFQAADPEYQEYLSKYSKKATKKETNKKGATSLADAELDD